MLFVRCLSGAFAMNQVGIGRGRGRLLKTLFQPQMPPYTSVRFNVDAVSMPADICPEFHQTVTASPSPSHSGSVVATKLVEETSAGDSIHSDLDAVSVPADICPEFHQTVTASPSQSGGGELGHSRPSSGDAVQPQRHSGISTGLGRLVRIVRALRNA